MNRTGVAVLFVALIHVGCVSPDGDGTEPTVGASAEAIVRGQFVSECGFPHVATMLPSNCTGTLIAPNVMTTAAHCAGGETTTNEAVFGEDGTAGTYRRSVSCDWVYGDGMPGPNDIAFCKLDTPITDLPITPPLFGCETEKYLKVGAEITLVGFGQTDASSPAPPVKRWAKTTVTDIESTPGRVGMIKFGEYGTSGACYGDSGGPAFIRMPDMSWREVGTTSHGDAGAGDCEGASYYVLVAPHVARFEKESGIDITPCFDAATGAWQAGPACTKFASGDATGVGTWANKCMGAAVSGPSDTCGDPVGGTTKSDAGTAGSGGSGGMPPMGTGGTGGMPPGTAGGVAPPPPLTPPIKKPPGEGCTSGTDCASGVCSLQSAIHVCVKGCISDVDCAPGLSCLGTPASCQAPAVTMIPALPVDQIMTGSSGSKTHDASGCSVRPGPHPMRAAWLLPGLGTIALARLRKRRGA